MNLWASCHFLEARRHAGPQALSKQISCDQIKTITFAKQKVTQGHYKLMKVTACLMFKVVDNKTHVSYLNKSHYILKVTI